MEGVSASLCLFLPFGKAFSTQPCPAFCLLMGLGGTCKARVTRHIFSQARPHPPTWEKKSVHVGTVLSEVLVPGFRRFFLATMQRSLCSEFSWPRIQFTYLGFLCIFYFWDFFFFFFLFFYTLGRRELRKQ